MISVDLRKLIDHLNPYLRRSLEGAAGLCLSRGQYEVCVEHLLAVLLQDDDRDLAAILLKAEIDKGKLSREVDHALETLRSGNTGRPVFSPLLIELLSDAWLLASIELSLERLRSGALVAALLARPERFLAPEVASTLEPLSAEALRKQFADYVAGSREEQPAKESPGTDAEGTAQDDSCLGRFTVDFIGQAKAGKIDPVFCRDREIEQIIDILGRRRKNNPIAVGEPGVGKTAVVEGLALKIAEDDVPDVLKGVDLRGLDLGLLQAGASVKGEFERRLRGVIDEVKASPRPIILFIDEAHTLIGAGGAAGGSDAANLLKPALARGELRTIAATTWSEYKKYFEKDPALARRFQLVKLDQPSPSDTVTILRGLRAVYEQSHGVYVRDDALVAAAEMSARYLSGRQLPDKAVDLLDTACARVKLSLSARPGQIDHREREIATFEREAEALRRDRDNDLLDNDGRLDEIKAEVERRRGEIAELEKKWQRQRNLVEELLAARERQNAAEAAEEHETLRLDIAKLRDQLQEAAGESPLIMFEVTPEAVAQVVADWTGVPAGKMRRDEMTDLLAFGDDLQRRIKGQDEAIRAIGEGLRIAKAGLANPRAPMGVFLCVGPSGVGKTETATAVADILFGGERFMVTINLSEFQEKDTVSRLIGSPPGYVGYGEGGVLTEAVRQRPYSVVLLDEAEKADLEVMNLFYQVFDKGTLSDGEGRAIDFKNTAIFLTSNLASDAITELGMREQPPSQGELVEAIHPILSRHFKPALLARMRIVPFYPLKPDVIAEIVKLKLERIVARLRDEQRVTLVYDEAVATQIATRCTEVETGARNIDHIINQTVLPQISTELLKRLADGETCERLVISVDEQGDFAYAFGAATA